jgi:hypothetical protein
MCLKRVGTAQLHHAQAFSAYASAARAGPKEATVVALRTWWSSSSSTVLLAEMRLSLTCCAGLLAMPCCASAPAGASTQTSNTTAKALDIIVLAIFVV